MKMALQVVFRKLVVLSRRKVKKSQRMWNKPGILELSNACVCEQAQWQERADLLHDKVVKQTREVLSPQQERLYRSMYPWASAFSTQHGFSHLLLPAFISKSLQDWHWIGTILTSLLCQPSLHSHHSAFTSTDLWQWFPPSLLRLQLYPLVFHFSSRQPDSLQWPSLATDVKTSWCCICKFLRWTVSYAQSSSSWAFQSPPSHDNEDVSWVVWKSLNS